MVCFPSCCVAKIPPVLGQKTKLFIVVKWVLSALFQCIIIVYRGHVEYDKNNDITCQKVTTTAPWSHRGSLEHNIEPSHVEKVICTDMIVVYIAVNIYLWCFCSKSCF